MFAVVGLLAALVLIGIVIGVVYGSANRGAKTQDNVRAMNQADQTARAAGQGSARATGRGDD